MRDINSIPSHRENGWKTNLKEYFWMLHLMWVLPQSFLCLKLQHWKRMLGWHPTHQDYSSCRKISRCMVQNNYLLIFFHADYFCCHKYSKCLQKMMGILQSWPLKLGLRFTHTSFWSHLHKRKWYRVSSPLL